MLEAGRWTPRPVLPGQEAGQFYLARESGVQAVRIDRCLLPTAQLPEERIALWRGASWTEVMARTRRAGTAMNRESDTSPDSEGPLGAISPNG